MKSVLFERELTFLNIPGYRLIAELLPNNNIRVDLFGLYSKPHDKIKTVFIYKLNEPKNPIEYYSRISDREIIWESSKVIIKNNQFFLSDAERLCLEVVPANHHIDEKVFKHEFWKKFLDELVDIAKTQELLLL